MQTLTENKIYYNKNGVIIRETQITDIFLMCDLLRETDKNEIWASHHHTPEEALRLSYEMSTLCLTINIKGIPIAMFGIAPQTLLSDSAIIWLLATDDFDGLIKKKRKEFFIQSKVFIKFMLEQYSLLENYVDARNIPSVKWLKWCGATIEEAHLYGVEQLPFYHFYFRRDN